MTVIMMIQSDHNNDSADEEVQISDENFVTS